VITITPSPLDPAAEAPPGAGLQPPAADTS